MVFVDGENFTLRGQDFATTNEIELFPGECWKKDTFLWLPRFSGDTPDFTLRGLMPKGVLPRARRAYYFTAVTGDDDELQRTKLAIRQLAFEPRVFKKLRGTQSKGVDVSLTTALVSNAYRDNYDVAYLVAGDRDYVPMVEEAQAAGKRVVLVFFEHHGLHTDLRIAADQFIDIGNRFKTAWSGERKRRERDAARTASSGS